MVMRLTNEEGRFRAGQMPKEWVKFTVRKADASHKGCSLSTCACVQYVRCVDVSAHWGLHGVNVSNGHVGRLLGGGKGRRGGRADSAVGSLICSDWQWWQIRCLWRGGMWAYLQAKIRAKISTLPRHTQTDRQTERGRGRESSGEWKIEMLT